MEQCGPMIQEAQILRGNDGLGKAVPQHGLKHKPRPAMDEMAVRGARVSG